MSASAQVFPPQPDLDALPELLRLRLTLRSDSAQRLPRLPSNAFRGALGQAARRLGDRSVTGLLEVSPDDGALESTTSRGPSALLVAGPFHRGPGGLRLAPGAVVEIDLTLVGERAVALEASVLRAARQAGEAGIGRLEGHEAHGEGRPPLHLASVRVLPPPDLSEAPHWLLDFTTPLRLRIRGRDALAPDADALWAAMLRRADHLARAHGQGPICARRTDVPKPFEASWEVAETECVSRVSARQGRAMRWPGTVGVLRLDPYPGAELAHLLQFLSVAGLGKGTPQGFGRFEPVPHLG